jgi:tetratricopeptide (TPR) repeat protein
MAYEQLREKGNKLYNKGKFYEAIEFYERAMSLFRWMEHQEPQNLSTTISEQQLPLEQSFDEASENGSKVNISLGNESAEG